MEGGRSGNNSTPIIDKTRVLDVEPLRTLVPVFPSSSNAPPFGPYSSGFAPFYPFSAPQGSQATPDLNQQTHTTPAAPLRSFRATESYEDDFDGEYESYDGSTGSAKRKPKSSSQKRARKIQDLDFTLSVDENNFVVGVSLSERDDGNREVVHSIQMRIQESWVEKAKSGCNIFKYKLARIPGQPDAFGVWKSIEKWREGLSSRAGLILPDITSGAESMPVALVNDVDEEKGPAYFTYVSTVKYSKSFKLTQPAYGCNCRNACQPGNLNCSCIRKNEGNFPYTANGVLVCRAPMIHECGPTCPCFPNCKNRASQTGLKARLEVFKTKDRGWGLRSWDSFRAGTFICEYAGEVIEKVSQVGEEGDGYVFDTSHVYESFKWNYEPGLVEEDGSIEAIEEPNVPSPLVISSKNVGNLMVGAHHVEEGNVYVELQYAGATLVDGLVQAHIFGNVNLGSNYFHPFSYSVMESDCSYDFVQNCFPGDAKTMPFEVCFCAALQSNRDPFSVSLSSYGAG
ncbi:hypothetical protein D5086_000323 [Populus alba]|uniref:Uncharacterized protein n=1 Tax=Populus alba TaxID=43335 RepID=A0ACC4CWS0_POPAL